MLKGLLFLANIFVVFLLFIQSKKFKIQSHERDGKTLESFLYDNSHLSQDCLFNENCNETIPFENFTYPLNVNMPKLVQAYRKKEQVHVQPIFMYPFHPITTPECKCGCHFMERTERKKDILILLVKSATDNFQRRVAIRTMWGNENQQEIKDKNIMIKTVFLLGLSTNKTVSTCVKSEILKYQDIVQLSYIDTYINNTYKTVGGLNWGVANCSKAKFLIFIDDDFYLNPFLVIEYLEGLDKQEIKSLFLGKVWNGKPQRSPKQKWNIPISVYPFNKYPPYLSAGFMLMSMEFAYNLHIAIQFTKRFKFDDVFLAIAAFKLGVVPQSNKFVRINKDTHFSAKDFNEVLAAHQYSDLRKLENAWKIYKNNHKNHTS